MHACQHQLNFSKPFAVKKYGACNFTNTCSVTASTIIPPQIAAKVVQTTSLDIRAEHIPESFVFLAPGY